MKEITAIQKIKCDNIFHAISAGGATLDNARRYQEETLFLMNLYSGAALSRIVGFSGEIPERFINQL